MALFHTSLSYEFDKAVWFFVFQIQAEPQT